VNDAGVWQTTVDDQPLNFVRAHDAELRGDPVVVWVEAEDGASAPPVTYAFWFAWYAHHPDEAYLGE